MRSMWISSPRRCAWTPQRQQLRRELQIQPEDHVLLYVGKISPVKNPVLLPQALAHLKPTLD